MCHMSGVRCHVSRVTCHVSRVMCHIFIFFYMFLQRGEISWWRVCYQRGLPRLVLECVNVEASRSYECSHSLSFSCPMARTATYRNSTVTVFISSCHSMTVYFMDHDSASLSWFCAYTLGLLRFKCVLPTMYLNKPRHIHTLLKERPPTSTLLTALYSASVDRTILYL